MKWTLYRFNQLRAEPEPKFEDETFQIICQPRHGDPRPRHQLPEEVEENRAQAEEEAIQRHLDDFIGSYEAEHPGRIVLNAEAIITQSDLMGTQVEITNVELEQSSSESEEDEDSSDLEIDVPEDLNGPESSTDEEEEGDIETRRAHFMDKIEFHRNRRSALYEEFLTLQDEANFSNEEVEDIIRLLSQPAHTADEQEVPSSPETSVSSYETIEEEEDEGHEEDGGHEEAEEDDIQRDTRDIRAMQIEMDAILQSQNIDLIEGRLSRLSLDH